MRLRTAGSALALAMGLAGTCPAQNPEPAFHDAEGAVHVQPLPVEARLNNPWPAEWERGLAARADEYLKRFAKFTGGSTAGEDEKSSYPLAMSAFLAGQREQALRFLQAEDAQAKKDHGHTLGIDYYYAFTLKEQIRKYFYVGRWLDGDYRDRMFRAAKIWTEKDPFRRPHPVYGDGGAEGWGPDARGSWVDVRRTDNLRAMTDTAVYLMAEETGNEATRKLYRGKILACVRRLYTLGMMEWDSESCHGQTMAAYHNLFDFARDPEVKLLAKAALDWLYAAAAVKYWRGGFGGPNCRDYGGANVVFGAGVSHPLALVFNDTAATDPNPAPDLVHFVTSAYRPPQAVVYLARKDFPRPVEVLATKPNYIPDRPELCDRPRYWETQHFGRTFQMGSVASAEPEETWNVSPLKLMAFSTRRGVDYFVANTRSVTGQAGKHAGDQIAQYRNLLIWLRPAAPAETFEFLVPRSAIVERDGGPLFLRYEKTWLALWPIQLGDFVEAGVPEQPDRDVKPDAGPRAEVHRDDRIMRAPTRGQGLAGFAMEVGEEGPRAGYAEFKQDVKTKARLDLGAVGRGRVRLTGTTGGATLDLTCNRSSDLPEIHRNGVAFTWEERRDVYACPTGPGPIRQDAEGGTLRVEAGGQVFTCAVSAEGKVDFTNAPAPRR